MADNGTDQLQDITENSSRRAEESDEIVETKRYIKNRRLNYVI